MWGLIMDEATSYIGNKDEGEGYFMSLLPRPIRALIDIDRAVADVIQNYVSLQVMTSWLWKKDQQIAEAQVQASVDKLSATLGEVKTKFGTSDLPRVPTNTRSFRPTQAIPPLDLDRDLQDDLLISNDGAAVTGISSVQAASLQKNSEIKKQQ